MSQLTFANCPGRRCVASALVATAHTCPKAFGWEFLGAGIVISSSTEWSMGVGHKEARTAWPYSHLTQSAGGHLYGCLSRFYYHTHTCVPLMWALYASMRRTAAATKKGIHKNNNRSIILFLNSSASVKSPLFS